jgi:hypothetical protein
MLISVLGAEVCDRVCAMYEFGVIAHCLANTRCIAYFSNYEGR